MKPRFHRALWLAVLSIGAILSLGGCPGDASSGDAAAAEPLASIAAFLEDFARQVIAAILT